jgi:hypothetical protein
MSDSIQRRKSGLPDDAKAGGTALGAAFGKLHLLHFFGYSSAEVKGWDAVGHLSTAKHA